MPVRHIAVIVEKRKAKRHIVAMLMLVLRVKMMPESIVEGACRYAGLESHFDFSYNDQSVEMPTQPCIAVGVGESER